MFYRLLFGNGLHQRCWAWSHKLLCIIGRLKVLNLKLLSSSSYILYIVSNFAPIFPGDSEPVKMFDRTANLANNQIINYKCSPDEKWLVLIGIAPGSPEVGLLRHIIV